jgi:molybdopterin/thiamine biosynthesis adenylyltransferase
MPQNSTRFLRQLDILPPEKLAFPITVIGAGAIGSAVVITLAKMGCTDIMVWDDDTIEEHNVSNQMCLVQEIGSPKTSALMMLTQLLSGITIKTRPERYRGQALSGVVIAATDNMEARQEVWKRAKMNRKIPLLIDARMGAEFARIYSIHPMNADEADFYQENLYSAGEAERLPCSARAIIYCPTIIGGLIALVVKSHAVGEVIPKEVLFDLPSLKLVCSRTDARDSISR